jgi:SAM-dependent methyltransferase
MADPGDAPMIDASLGSFSAVDAEPDAATLVAALDEQASMPAIQRLRATTIELLGVRLGQRVLDAGCGTGDLARSVARIVGSAGCVVGIEASTAMLAEARRRVDTDRTAVDLRHGDICRLELGDGTFDAAVSERVFQHLARPADALAELVRVTRPGGRVAVIDTDWGMHAVEGADPTLSAAVVDAWRANAANGTAGRRLPALFADAGLRDRIVVAESVTSTDPRRPEMQPFPAMAANAERCGAIRPGDASRWLRQLSDAGRQGRFFWALTMFAIAGLVPQRQHVRPSMRKTMVR